MSEKVLVPRELTEAQEEAFWQAWGQYQKWKRDEVFPRPVLPAHLWDAMTRAADSSQAILDDCAALAAEREKVARLVEWLAHERDLCEAAGDRAGRIAYQRVLNRAALASVDGAQEGEG